MKRSQHPELSCPDIVNDLRSIHQSLVNPWLICYGKDMVKLLAYGLRSVLGSNNKGRDVRPKMIMTYLRLSFDWSDLNKSKLSQDLRAWVVRNPDFRVLQSAQTD